MVFIYRTYTVLLEMKICRMHFVRGSIFPYCDVGINKPSIKTSKLDLSLTRKSANFVLDLTCKRS